MLTTRLRRLEREGIVERRTKATSPATIWYGPTMEGQDLGGALTQVFICTDRSWEYRVSILARLHQR